MYEGMDDPNAAFEVIQWLEDSEKYQESVDQIVEIIKRNFTEASDYVEDSVSPQNAVFSHSALPIFFNGGSLCVFTFRDGDKYTYKLLDAEDSQRAWEILSKSTDGEYVNIHCSDDESIPFNLIMSRGKYPYVAQMDLYKGPLKYFEMNFGEIETLKHGIARTREYQEKINNEAVPIFLNGKPMGVAFGNLEAVDLEGKMDLSYLKKIGKDGMRIDVYGGHNDVYSFKLVKNGKVIDASNNVSMYIGMVPVYGRTMLESYEVLDKLKELRKDEVLYQVEKLDSSASTVWNGLSWDSDGKPVIREISTDNTIDEELAAGVFGVVVSTGFILKDSDYEEEEGVPPKQNVVNTFVSWKRDNGDIPMDVDEFEENVDQELQEGLPMDRLQTTFESMEEIPDILMAHMRELRGVLAAIKEKYPEVNVCGIPGVQREILRRAEEAEQRDREV